MAIAMMQAQTGLADKCCISIIGCYTPGNGSVNINNSAFSKN
jgi:hypothetical protein